VEDVSVGGEPVDRSAVTVTISRYRQPGERGISSLKARGARTRIAIQYGQITVLRTARVFRNYARPNWYANAIQQGLPLCSPVTL
jgi:hypothetical protein